MKPRYYERSGRVGALAPLWATGVGFPLAAIFAFLYTLFVHYNPFVYFSFLGTCIFGLAIGLATTMAAHAGKSRSMWFDVVASLAASLVGLWAHWMTWTWLVFDDGKEVVKAIAFAGPARWLEHISYCADNYAVGIGSHGRSAATVDHGSLLAVWAIEAVLVVGGAAVAAWGTSETNAFSEQTEKWAKQVGKAELELGALDVETLKAALLDGKLDALHELELYVEARHAGSDTWSTVVIELHAEASDASFRLVTVRHEAYSRDKNGKPKSITSSLVEWQFVAPDTFARLVERVENKPTS